MKNIFSSFFLVSFLVAIMLPACRHELSPLPLLPIDPMDTSVVVTPPDSFDSTGIQCSPDTVYFVNQILPLLNSNCSLSGCHDAQSHKDGVITTDYAHIMDDIKAFNPNQSKIYKSLIDSDPDDRMPRPPAPAFTQEQIDLVKTWILQGAQNNSCNEGYGQCDTTNVTYSNYVQPLVAAQCLGCHGENNPGGSVKLTTYDEVKTSVLSGEFYGSITWGTNYIAMPQNSAKLSNCQLSKVKAWIDADMPQ